jgi:beta-lactamase class A
VTFGKNDLVAYSPALEQGLAQGQVTVAELIRAVLELSDNGAANLLLRTQGGPEGLTRYLRGTGDRVTRLDRIEPDLNSALPGDLRDTSTPAAMVGTLKSLVTGRLLTPAGRDSLITTMTMSRTGLNRLRKDLPSGWRGADKTGTGQRGSTNDVAILWPPNRPPILVSAYLTETDAALAEREAVLAEVGRRVVLTLSLGRA